MANNEALDRRVGMAYTATWGTEAAATRLLDHTSFEVTEDFNKTMGRDESSRTSYAYTYPHNLSANVNISGKCSFEGNWLALLWSVCRWTAGGSGGAPTEVTVGQGDYFQNRSMHGNSGNNRLCMAWHADSDTAYMCKSVLINSMTLSAQVNQPVTYTASGIADGIFPAVTNTPTTLNALSRPRYEEMIFSGSGSYFRLGTSFVSALNSGNDVPILGWSMTISRNESPEWTLRGANSKYSREPRFTGRISQTLQITLADVSNDTIDYLARFTNSTQMLGEVAIGGTQIGTGTNRAFRILFPLLDMASNHPGGIGIQEGTIAEPVIDFNCLFRRAGAPTGMTLAYPQANFTNSVATGYNV